MKRTLFFTVLLLFSVTLSPLFAQENSIFTPFVSRIKLESDKSSIKISWKDTADVDGNCILYRHTSPITEENFTDAVKVARIPKGVEYYEDFPPYTSTDYFYAIFMEGEDSLLHKVFIPFRNLSTQSASITEKAKDDTPALVTAIKAWTGKDSIQLSFKCSKPSAELFIYRNSEPIEDKNDILSANLIASLSGAASSFTDYPVPGIGYYYGIIDSNLIKTGNYIFKAGENITIVPVELEIESTERIGLPEVVSSRPKPLPYLSISRGYQTGRQLAPSIIDSIPERKDLSASSEESVKQLIESTSVKIVENLEPTILKQDKNPETGSEQAMLAEILNNDFINSNFESARVKLLEFQKIKRTKQLEASIHFYLGQIDYFTGDFRSAFTEFLFAEEYYYMESRPWIDSLFRNLRTVSN